MNCSEPSLLKELSKFKIASFKMSKVKFKRILHCKGIRSNILLLLASKSMNLIVLYKIKIRN